MDYQKIDLNEYNRTGEGGTAVSYTHKTRNTLAKLYNPGFEADRAKQEFLIARSVFDMGIPTPEPIRLVTDGERFGAEYELIPGKRSFTRIISQEPERLEEISIEFARLARKLHETKADITKLSSYKQRILQFYSEKNLVPDEYKRRALGFLERVPDTPTCVHGDLQIGNIITDGKRTLWIDVGEFGYGAPEWDLSLMWTICNNMARKGPMTCFTLHTKFSSPTGISSSRPTQVPLTVRLWESLPNGYFRSMRSSFPISMTWHITRPFLKLLSRK